MTQHQPGNLQGFVDKSKAKAGSAADTNGSVATPANYDNEDAINTRLTAIDATAYSATKLDTMTLNDKVYALRLNDDAGTL